MPKTQDRREMLARVRGFLKGKARVRMAGSDFGPWRSEPDAVQRIDALTSRLGVGPKLIVQRESDMEQLSIREVTSKPSFPDLGAAPEIEAIHAEVWAEFDVRSGGLWFCRFIDGTHSVSKHGYLNDDPAWKGAAEDIFVIDGGMEDLKLVAEFIVAETKAGRLKAATVIVDLTIWTPAAGWHVYTGDRHFHVHVDVLGGHPCSP
jgi:hypothetical protein